MTWRWFIGMKINRVRRRLARWIAPTPEATGWVVTGNTIRSDPAHSSFIESKGDE